MALEFPASPNDGQLYPNPAVPGVQQYKWNAAKGAWETLQLGVVQAVTGTFPIGVSGTVQTPDVNIAPATVATPGSMSAADKAKLDSLNPNASVQAVTAGTGLGAPNSGDTITNRGTIRLLPANDTTIGGVKPGPGVSVQTDGSLILDPPTTLEIGGVRAGAGVSITPEGVISLATGSTFKVLDNIGTSFDGTRLSFQLTVGGVPFTPPSASALLIFVGGIFQIPGQAFNVGGNQIQFTSAPAANLTFYGVSLT
jgi:hypothetical protein